MTIHWTVLVPGVLLLLFPADRLLSSLVELRSFDCFQSLENSPRYRPWWWVPLLWIDPVRSFLGTILILQSLTLASSAWAVAPKAAYALALAILAAGILIQTFTRRGDRDVLLAPMGYVAGVVAALAPLPVAAIGIVTAALGLFALRQFYAYFVFGLAAVALLGFVLDAGLIWIAPAIGAFALPLFAVLITGSTLELPTRNASRPAAAPPHPSS